MTRVDESQCPMESGHLGCPGCGEALGLRLVLEAIGENTIMVVPSCCASYVDGQWPHSAVKIPILHVAMETTAAAAAGIRAALEAKGRHNVRVLAWAGGTGAFDSGIHAVSSVAERNDDILYVCYNNEPYAKIDFLSADLSDNTPAPQRQNYHPQKNIMQIMAAHYIPYCATACVAYPDDLSVKVKKALSYTGFRFLQLLSPCPTHWEMPSELSVEITRAAVQSRIFPLYEIENGSKYTINITPETFTPVTKFILRQGRFSSLSSTTIRRIQSHVESQWKWLVRMTELGHSPERHHAKP